MDIEYRGSRCYKINYTAFYYGPDPFDSRQRELELQYRSDNDPEGPPKPERGDIYIVIGTIVGLIVGGALGTFGGPGGIVGGAIAGGIIGAIVGGVIKKRRVKTKTDAKKPF